MEKLYRTVFIVFLLMVSPCIMIRAEESANLPAEVMQPASGAGGGIPG